MDGITKGHMFISHGPGDITAFERTTVTQPAQPLQRYKVDGEVVLKGGEHIVVKHTP